ncbi:hypothetical protein [Pseudothioclava nitratireducens]|jgi:hypothetical protein|uniref:hypothetical protein n=1 Tax=Pseudothioclava nitratireducens TaxID=1928646 RepID=UPI0023DAD6FA|nr:hypothetical protein [Defluviimonas nitratireducens]MDF1621122.1 hypothetical protein [Defluviimonas nitratireducens]
MINDFISMLAAGFLAVAIVYAANHAVRKVTGSRLPKWVMPAAAGLAMLGYTIYAEYDWYPKTRANLNEGVEVIMSAGESSWWRPWTYVAPITTRFMAIDRNGLTHPGGSATLVRGELLLVQRWAPVRAVPVAFDCLANARADLIDGTELDATGALRGGDWLPLERDDAALRVACNGG